MLSSATPRKRIETLYRKYRGILILANSFTPAERKQVDRSLAIMPKLPRKQLYKLIEELQTELKEITQLYGFRGTLADIDRFLGQDRNEIGEKLLFLSKYQLLQLFTHYERALPIFSKLPPHARISIDTFGIHTERRIETFQLEERLFEDMAALWNSLLDLENENINKDLQNLDDRVWLTKYGAVLRSIVKAAFSLIDGIVNCISFDILVSREAESLTLAEKEKLHEWDFRLQRPRLMKLRDKLLQYPKIATSSEHPPIQESNCKAMKVVLEKEESLRHTFVHPSPYVLGRAPSREDAFLNQSRREVEELCDNVVALIQRLYAVLGTEYGDPSLWLYARNAEGRFPPECFKNRA
jgi:hypothetical protein